MTQISEVATLNLIAAFLVDTSLVLFAFRLVMNGVMILSPVIQDSFRLAAHGRIRVFELQDAILAYNNHEYRCNITSRFAYIRYAVPFNRFRDSSYVFHLLYNS